MFMEYNKLIAVTGMPGLFELVASKTDGAIVRSLEDNSTKFVSSRVHNFSHLESIEIYTIEDNVNLAEILKAMESSSVALPSEKDNIELKDYFKKVFSKLDFERVYASDMKKIVKWFSIIKKAGIEVKIAEPATEEITPAPVTEEVAAPVIEEAKPAKKAKAKKPATKAADDEKTVTEEKPKKTARKKKTEE
jgi:Domain of unknown function (DUF5606)